MKISPIFLVIFFSSFCIGQSMVEFDVTDTVVYSQNTGLLISNANLSENNFFTSHITRFAFPDTLRIVEDSGKVLKLETKIYSPYQELMRTQSYSEKPKTPIWSILDVIEENMGKSIQIHGSKGIYSGIITWYDRQSNILFFENVTYTLSDTGKTSTATFLSLPLNQIISVVLIDKPTLPSISTTTTTIPPSMDADKLEVSWEDTSSEERTAVLTYLTSGLSWKPSFFLDVPSEDNSGLSLMKLLGLDDDKARMSFWVRIKNNLDINLTDVNLKLVAGNINLVTQGYPDEGYTHMRMEQRALSNVYPQVSGLDYYTPSVGSIEEYEVYEFPNPITLISGESVSLPIFNDYVEYEKDYVWDARSSSNWYNYNNYDTGDEEGKVKKIYRIKNTGKTWPNGMVSVFQNFMLTGQDTIEWTPKGREAKVTLGSAPDIEVKRRHTSKVFYQTQSGYDKDYNHTVTLTLKNYKSNPVEVLVIDSFPQNAENFTAKIPYEEKPGNLIHWKLMLKPGEEKNILYNYITD